MNKNNNIKKFVSLIMLLVLSLTLLTACSEGEEVEKLEKSEVAEEVEKVESEDEDIEDEEETEYLFEVNDDGTVTDSAGRTVELPESIDTVVPAGNPAQMVLYSLIPEKIVGWAYQPSEDTLEYIAEEHRDLPKIGTFYGKKADMNIEELIKANPDLIIDIGETKDNIDEDMDMIQEQTGIPTIFIEGTLETLPDMYTALGKLFDKEEECLEKAKYINETLKDAKEKSEKIAEEDRITVYYASGETGLQTSSESSIHADVLKLIGAKNVFEDDGENITNWEDVSMEQIITWDPEVIILTPESNYDTIMEDPVWEGIKAVEDERVYEVPAKPYNWLGRPPMINRVIGIKWAGNLLYPEVYDYDMVKEAQEFYKLFYNYDLTEAEAKDLMSESLYK